MIVTAVPGYSRECRATALLDVPRIGDNLYSHHRVPATSSRSVPVIVPWRSSRAFMSRIRALRQASERLAQTTST